MPAVPITLHSRQIGLARRAPIADPAGFSTLCLSDGRELAWHAFGDPQGRPLYFFHGFPSSRLLASLVHEQAAAAGIRVIAPDRPGFGRSTPHPARSIHDWPKDVARLADHLGHTRFGVLGVSCGGPYALACARAMPQRLAYAGLMAGIGPMDQPDIRRGQMRPLKVLFGLAGVHPALAGPMLLADAWLFRADPERAIAALSRLLSAPDRQLLAENASLRMRFCASFVEAYRQGIAGARQEVRLIARLNGDLLRGIDIPVHVYQGGRDRHVPAAMGRHIAGTLTAGQLHFYPDEGHLSILVNRFSDCSAHFTVQSVNHTETRA